MNALSINTPTLSGRSIDGKQTYVGQFAWQSPSIVPNLTNIEFLMINAISYFKTTNVADWDKQFTDEFAIHFSILTNNPKYSPMAVLQQIRFVKQSLQLRAFKNPTQQSLAYKYYAMAQSFKLFV